VKTKLLKITTMAIFMLMATTIAKAQQPCLPSQHGLTDNQSAFCGVTQTIALSEGINWFSTYVDITLDDLKSALVAAVPNNTTIIIKSANENTTYSRNRWNGSLTWDVAKMYVIKVASDCELTLEGTLIDPAEHSIAITGNGVVNWIGYPYTENMSITNAFNGFAVNGDIFRNQENNSVYNRGNWNGGVTQLEPGKGYRYKSASTAADRVFTFPTTSKATNP